MLILYNHPKSKQFEDRNIVILEMWEDGQGMICISISLPAIPNADNTL